MLLLKPISSFTKRFFLFFLIAFLSCNKNDPTPQPTPNPTPPPVVNPPAPLSTEKEITYFGFKVADNASLTIEIKGIIGSDSIKLFLPSSISPVNLVPSINIKGKSISPQAGVPQNFSNPINYTVTAEDGTTKKYVVTATQQALSATIFLNTVNMAHNAFPNTTNKGYLYVIDPSTGTLRWKYEPTLMGFYGSPTFSNGILFTANSEKIIAIDVASRKVKWEFLTKGFVQSSLLLVNRTLYFNCNDGTIYALDASNGSVKWKTFYERDPSNLSANESSPTVVNGTIYFAGRWPTVYAMDANAGSLKWKRDFQIIENKIISNPSVANGIVYFGDYYGNFYALNADDGTTKWSVKTSTRVTTSPTLVNGIVYVTDMENLYAFDALTGTVKWKYHTTYEIYGSPIVSNGIVCFAGKLTTTSKLFALDAATGTEKWTYPYGISSYVVSPVAVNNTVYFAIKGDLLSFEITTGKLNWIFHSEDAREDAFGPPCIVDDNGNVFYSSESGHHN
jgi:outer membrane protein assembly factor BamB